MTLRPLAAGPGPGSRRGAVTVAVGLLFTALISVGQSLLLTAIVGEGAGTDAFLAAYSLFVPVALLGASLRGQLLPLFGALHPERPFRRRASEICSRAALLGGLLALLLLVTAPLTAPLVTSGLSAAASRQAVYTLVLLAPAAYLQFRAASLSALLAGARRFEVSAALYVAGGLVSLAGSAVLLGPVGPLGAAIGLLLGAVSLLVGHEVYVRRFGIRLAVRPRWIGERAQWALTASLLGYSALGLTQQLNLSVALSAVSDRAGDITLYTFAFLMVLMMLNVTSTTLGFVLLPDLMQGLASGAHNVATDHMVRVGRLSFALLVPLLALYLADGLDLMRWALAPFFAPSSVDRLWGLGAVFCLLAVPTSLLQTAISIAVASGRWPTIPLVAAMSLALQVVAVAIVRDDSTRAVAAAHVLTGTATAVLFLGLVFRGSVLRLVWPLLRPLLAASALSTVVFAVRIPLGDSPSTPGVAVATIAGIAAYAAGLLVFWPSVGTSLLRRSPRKVVASSSASTDR